MTRGPIYSRDYRPQLSGHETFPLRYGWLKKAFDAIRATEDGEENKSVFLGDDAIARFGVGKNMVRSMRHWANSTGIVEEVTGSNVIHTTEFGRKIFASDGLDPYMENPATAWLLHWRLAARPEKTTWFWAFNHYSMPTFDRDAFVMALQRLAREQEWSRVAKSTVKNDVACFIRTYVTQRTSAKAGHEDALESPLTELGLIKPVGRRDGFRFVRGPKPTLGDGVFAFGLIDFWLRRFSSSATLSFEAIAHEPGGLGRVFLLDENTIASRLSSLEDTTSGALRWSETAGLKQVVRDCELNSDLAIGFVNRDYGQSFRQEAA